MQEEHPADTGSASGSSNHSKKKILVVDDEETILELSESILKTKGYSIDTASDGERAKALISKQSYNLVITDLRMPGTLNGMDLFRWIQENRADMEDRVVFMTGDSLAEEVQSFLKETNRPCLLKPFSVGEYLSVVEEILEAQS